MLSSDVTKLRQQLPSDLVFCPFYHFLTLVVFVVAAKKISQLEDTISHCQTEHHNAVLKRDDAKYAASRMQRTFDLEKKNHKVTCQEARLAYSLLTEAYNLMSP